MSATRAAAAIAACAAAAVAAIRRAPIDLQDPHAWKR
jgi:hypothetical protein